jgi:hypothetical protein
MNYQILLNTICCALLVSCQPNNNSKSKNKINIDSSAARTSDEISKINNNIIDSNAIRAFDKIYFGKINPTINNETDYLEFLSKYETALADVMFYYWPPSERYDSKNGLYGFGLATKEVYDLSEASKISDDVISIINLKYSPVEKFHFSDKQQLENIHSIFEKNLEKGRTVNKSGPELNVPYNSYDYRWVKNGVEILYGYRIEFQWVDNNGNLLELDGSDISLKINGQKKVYRPILKFTYKKVMDKVSADYKKDDKEFKRKSLENDASKF